MNYSYGVHLRKEHWKGKKRWISCLECQIRYSVWIALTLYHWKIYNKNMDSLLQWVLIIIAMSIPPLIAGIFSYFLSKKKVEAETEGIQLKNEITKNITYEQLQKESKRKDIKGKIDIFQQLLTLEEQIKSKKDKTGEDVKKLESLEMIKKEFKQSFEEEKNPELAEEKPETKKISKRKI